MKQSTNRGFTLIELLVVIAIIGLLSSIVLSALVVARKSGNDSKRTQQMQQIANALELYALDNDGDYPATSGGTCATCADALASVLAPSSGKKYISEIPNDPVFTGTNSYRYQRCTGNKSYTLMMGHETGRNTGSNASGPGIGGWCQYRYLGRPYSTDGCWMNSDDVTPAFGWCDDEI